MTTSAHGPSAGQAVERRVGVVTGDRLCAACGFNLGGQTIVREAHYDMLMVRCPECGAPAALQEYPFLGKWASRWGALLAAAWLVAMVGGLAVTALFIAGMANETAEEGIRPLARRIASLQMDWYAEQSRLAAQGSAGYAYYPAYAQSPLNEYMPLDPRWWGSQDPASILAGAAASGGVYDMSCMRTWVLFGIVLFVVGVVWSVALMHVGRRRIWVVAVVLALAGGAAIYLWRSPLAVIAPMIWSMGWTSATGAAFDMAGAPLRWATVGASVVPLMLGLLIGRPVTRLAARLLLAPRLRGALGILWACDNLPMPRTRR